MTSIQNKLAEMKGVGGKAMQHVAGTAKDKQLSNWTRYDAEEGNPMTTNTGVKVSNDEVTLAATGNGKQGPILLAEDFHMREKVNHFDHEPVPERVVHARGTAAHGVFEVKSDKLKAYTYAGVLTDTSRETPVFVRFSTVAGSRGSADTVRDVRGFATKFYTEEGNWDLVGNNIPVFFIQDAIKFPDVIHSVKPEPHNEIPQAASAHDNFWDFAGLSTETAHMLMWVMSDRAIPKSFRTMQGFGVNTFSLVTREGKRTLCKFHWAPHLGIHSLVWDECLKINGADPDFHRRDLWENIENGNYPKWDFGVQLMDEADWDNHTFDPHDATKIWPEEQFPIHYIGEMTLNRNPAEFFAETEQVAFCTQNIVPGIDFSDDPLLQGRNFSYLDTQMTRLGGPNFMEIPINRPVCPVFNNQRGGFMRQTISASRVNYHPNRFDHPKVVSPENGGFIHYAEKIAAMKQRLAGPKFAEHYDQATLFYNSMTPVEKRHIQEALQFELGRVDDDGVKQRIVDQILVNIDHDLAKTVSEFIGTKVPAKPSRANHGRASKYLSLIASSYTVERETAATRKVGILIADGYDESQVTAIRSALKAAGAVTEIVGIRKGPHQPGGLKSDFTFHTQRSVAYDGLAVPGGASSITTLLRNGTAKSFLNEAYKHHKPILALGEGVQLLQQTSANNWQGVQFASDGTDKVVQTLGVVTASKYSGGIGQKIASAVGADSGDAIGVFIKLLSKHRIWERTVDTVPA